MKDLTQVRIASALTILLGVLLLSAPLAFIIKAGALISVQTVGVILIISGLAESFSISSFPSWIDALGAIWLFISVFVFRVNKITALFMGVAALIILALSSWDSIEAESLRTSKHRHSQS